MLYYDKVAEFQKRARNREVCLGVHTSAMSPQLVELYGVVGLDFVILGTEVESIDMSKLEDMIRAASAAGTVPIVKLRRATEELIEQAMNAGAPMVMAPHVTNRAQLDELVRATRFIPEGTRGKCPLARYNGYGGLSLDEVHRATNSARSLIPIIEDREALDNLDELMACPDVDIFEIGPFDLSSSLGDEGRGYSSERSMAAIEDITEAARRHGKVVLAPLAFTLRTESIKTLIDWQIEELIARGITILYGMETVMLVEAFSPLKELRKVRIVEDEDDDDTANAADS